MAYTPQTWVDNDASKPLSAARLTVMETGIEDADTRVAAVEVGAFTPQTITYAASITPNATLGSLFRCIATGDLTLNDPTGGVDGQTVTVQIQASGANRVLSFTGGTPAAITVPSGAWWSGQLRYYSTATTWLLDDGAV